MIWPESFAFWPLLVAIVNFAVAVAVSIHIIFRKDDPRSATLWTGLVWLAPLLGAVAYFCFGVNRLQRKATSLQVRKAWKKPHSLELPDEYSLANADFASRHPHLEGLAKLGQSLTRQTLTPGNVVRPLLDGDEAYPAMLEAIEKAEKSISLLSYIFDNDRAGKTFLDALEKACRRGIEVRVLIDGVGARYSRPTILHACRARAIPCAAFLPTLVPRSLRYSNLRNHRKILVIDGNRGFTGGTNIREDHWRALQPHYPIHCLHFELIGPVVSHLQETFAIDWAFASGESLSGDTWFPTLAFDGPVWARGIPDGPDEDYEKLSDTLVGALGAAQDFIRIVTPYFLPTPSLLQSLRVAARRGVDVRIYTPEKCNIAGVGWAADAMHKQILETGCRLFQLPPPFDHSKLMVVDGAWSLIGSTNWDPRSLNLNFEFNVECYSEQLASQLEELLEAKAAIATEVTWATLNERAFPIRLRNGIARLFSPYL